MAARHSQDLTAFHVSVAGHPDLDERRFAEQLTGRLEIPFVPFELNGDNFRRALPLVIYLSDLPLTHPNSIAYYLISKVAREHGVIVLLSGEGADELFGGYSWAYRRTPMAAAAAADPRSVAEAVLRAGPRSWSTPRPACR